MKVTLESVSNLKKCGKNNPILFTEMEEKSSAVQYQLSEKTEAQDVNFVEGLVAHVKKRMTPYKTHP